MSRLDCVLVDRNMIKSRESAKSMIKDGKVTVNGIVSTKPALNVSDDDIIEVTGEFLRYVGRGGLKLEKAIDKFGIKLDGLVCMDVGASTGGFTDCMLQNGATKIFAIDVGIGQLAEKLIADNRVINLERTDLRDVTGENLECDIDFVSADVSFISLKHILPRVYELLMDGGQAVVLIKPQFEAGKQYIGKNGVVKSANVHRNILMDMTEFARNLGFCVSDICCSPVAGAKGNIEYLMNLYKNDKASRSFNYKALVDEAMLVRRSK